MKNAYPFNILIFMFIAGTLCFLPTSAFAETYTLDPDHSAVVFRIMRKDFGMDYMPNVVGNKVVLTISVEGVRE